jgi:pimeloyl-ACP methyl ester carboxylesterase
MRRLISFWEGETGMPTATANGIDIAYETFGSASHPALVLVMGLGRPMEGWDAELCGMIADRGFFVIRFDNRDVGRSTRFTGTGPTDPDRPPYTLDDMAGDVVGLLDALRVERAHLVGASMGGMIVQLVTINHPHRPLSLCSIMSAAEPIATDPGTPAAAVIADLAAAPPDRAASIEQEVRMRRMLAGPDFPIDEQRVRARAAAAWDNDPVHDRGNIVRQVAAIRAAADRRPALGQVRVPTLVIHGCDDPLVNAEGGKETAAAIPGAELVLIPGMGHDLPERLWPELVDIIVANTARSAG